MTLVSQTKQKNLMEKIKPSDRPFKCDIYIANELFCVSGGKVVIQNILNPVCDTKKGPMIQAFQSIKSRYDIYCHKKETVQIKLIYFGRIL